REVDDSPAAAPAHPGHERLHHAQDREDVQLEELARGFELELLERAERALGAERVHAGVDGARLADEALHVVVARHVGLGQVRADSLAAARLHRGRDGGTDRPRSPGHEHPHGPTSSPNCVVSPPSTVSTAPVTKDARSEQRNETAYATSSAP